MSRLLTAVDKKCRNLNRDPLSTNLTKSKAHKSNRLFFRSRCSFLCSLLRLVCMCNLESWLPQAKAEL